MTDRELLEKAAKAAGFQNYTLCGDTVFIETGAQRGDSGYYWNPLIDDSDALRLAVKLRMTPHIDSNSTECSDCFEVHSGDPFAATRRAIVRAAAALAGD